MGEDQNRLPGGSRMSDRTTPLLACALILMLAGPATAGKNDGGSMIVHTDDAIIWTFTDHSYCDDYDAVAPADCASAVTQSNVDGATDAAILWFLAAFHADAMPGITFVYFGVDHNLPAPYIPAWGACGPEGTLEIHDDGWPHDPGGAGCSVAFMEPVVGQSIFPFYWFAAYGSAGKQVRSAANPDGGYAAFVSDDEPGFLDEVTRFGTMRWFAPGENSCPVPPVQGACCLPNGTCTVLLKPDCEGPEYEGIYQGDGTTCEAACGPCCYWGRDFDVITRRCVVTSENDCLDEEGYNEIQLDVLVGDPPMLETVGAEWGPPGVICAIWPGDPINVYCLDPREGPFEPDWVACCDEFGNCEVRTSGSGCHLYYVGLDCEPNPCTPEPVESISWGKIRILYR